MKEYIYTLEENSGAKTEAEWREIIAADIEDVQSQDPEAEVIDIDEAIQQLEADGYIISE